MTTKPRAAGELGPLFAAASAPVRGDEPPHAHAHTRAGARAYTHARADAQEAAGKDAEVAARVLAAALNRVGERRAYLAAMVAAARSAQVPDEAIRARLVIAGLPEAEIAAALA